jgi:hypothetical protein
LHPAFQKWDAKTDNMEEFSVYRNIKEVDQSHTRTVPWVVERIKRGANAELVERIRQEPDKSKRNNLKRGLLSICWSGTFKKRQDNLLIKHSGLVGVDFDHVPNLEEVRDRLKADPYVHVLFTSPSGDGLKAVVRIPPDAKTHKGSFDALMEHFGIEQFDPKNYNLSRVCYESFDPDIYYNADSAIFEVIVEDRHYDVVYEMPDVRISNEEVIIEKLLKWHQRKYPLVEGQLNNNSYILLRAFNRFGISRLRAEQYIVGTLGNHCNADDLRQLVANAYKHTDEHGTKAFEDKATIDYIKSRSLFGDAPAKISQELATQIPDKQEREAVITKIVGKVDGSQFWSKTNKGVVIIHDHRFQAFLEDNGFRKLYPEGSTNFIFVKVVSNLVYNTSEKVIKDFTLNYIKKEVGDMAVYDKLAGTTKLFNAEYLSMLEPISLSFAEDTRAFCNLYYRNYCVQVYRDKLEAVDYANLGGYIWADQVIDRDYHEGATPFGEFQRFVNFVAGPNVAGVEDRYNAHCTTLGYLLHGFKDLSNNRAVIYNDSTIDENPNGGSGKGIMMQALRSIKRVVELDGKTFSFDKGFPYQTVGADTQVLVFDDVQRYFAFERLFSIITEGITLEKKNKDAVKIPVWKSPKIVITTNYTIQGDGGSHERRRWEVEMSDYFGVHHTPAEEFGHQLFHDWDEEEWSRFDAFIVGCIQMYLKEGLTTARWKNLHNRKLAGKTDADFYEWASEEKLPVNVRIYKGRKMEEFTEEYKDYGPRGKKTLTDKRWKKWLDAYGAHHKYEVDHGQDSIGRYVVFKTSATAEVATPVTEEAPF